MDSEIAGVSAVDASLLELRERSRNARLSGQSRRRYPERAVPEKIMRVSHPAPCVLDCRSPKLARSALLDLAMRSSCIGRRDGAFAQRSQVTRTGLRIRS